MQSLWNEQAAAACADDLALRVYSSRLLGRDPALVLHGGGNTSVKLTRPNIFGEAEDLLYVKGSGWDLATIEAPGFAPVRMAHLLRLAELDALSDLSMANELRTATTLPSAPAPSVEAILHAIIPFTFVDHTHADALISVCNSKDGAAHIQQLYGADTIIVPYVMPGFELARACHALWQQQFGPHIVGMVLMHHGLFTFAATAREAYERHIELVTRAEEYLAQHNAWQVAVPEAIPATKSHRQELANLRRKISTAAGQPMLLASHDDPQCLGFARRDDLVDITQQGPATPDHVIRTKRVPQLGRDVTRYVLGYRQYFEEHKPAAGDAAPLQMLDPAPRVILDPEFGMCCVGRSAGDAAIAAEIYRHTIDIIQRAEALGGWRALPAQQIFDVEYWDLEQAKLKRAGRPPVFAGEIALVTGAASGIGRACVESLLARGAAVAALDINPGIGDLFKRRDVIGLRCNVADEADVERALEATVKAFGGLDMLILNAGIFPSSRKIADLPLAEWERTQQVNLNANVTLLREAFPLLKLASRGGRVVLIGSKNVPAPGPGAAAYSASKAALTQLARVAALEWGGDGIRVNVLHPNAVFDTGIWTDEVLQTRAANYGMSIEEYKTNNLLHTEVHSHDVAELAAELCGTLFAKTTGAQIPIDGGNERVI